MDESAISSFPLILIQNVEAREREREREQPNSTFTYLAKWIKFFSFVVSYIFNTLLYFSMA